MPAVLDLTGPAGRLEALIDVPQATPKAAVVFAHPLPTHGGTMHTKVVYQATKGLVRTDRAVLRFNFRGVGASEGVHHGEGGEEQDLTAALDHLERELPGLPLWAGGFSFGSRTVASRARFEPRIRRVALVALPTKAYDCSFVRELEQPTYLLLAGEDEFGTPDDLRERVGPLGANFELEVIEGVDHFFRGRTPEVEARVRAWAGRSLEAA